MIIDFHTHLFPEKVAERAITALEQNIKDISHIDYRAEHKATRSDLLKSMDICGIDISVLLPVATKPSQVYSINDFAKTLNNEERFISFGSLHPEQSDIDKELERIAEMGLKGIKMHPESQKMYIDSPVSIHIMNKAYELGLIVVLHTGSDLGCPPPVHSSPERFKSALDYFDGSNIIAGHFGGFRMWEDVLKYLAGTNVYFDTALALREVGKDLFFEILSKHSADKIVYGSDSPWERQNLAYEYMKKWNVPDMDKICYKNAQRLLGIE